MSLTTGGAAEKSKKVWESQAWKNAPERWAEDLQETYRLMLPGKDVTALMFTSRGAWDKNNAYVAECSRRTGFPALYYSRPEQSPEELEAEIRKGGFLGLKSYLSLSPKYLPEAEIRIFDFFPKAQLKKMDELGAIVMLHIPRNGRLKDPVNLAQIMEIKQEFPNIRLIIAHIGRAYTREDVGNAFETLDKAPDLMYDFCANCCEYDSLLLNNMEKSDLIQRVPVAEDARLKKIILTEKAMILNQNISMAINSVENKLSENITLEEINVFYRVLDKIRNNLE